MIRQFKKIICARPVVLRGHGPAEDDSRNYLCSVLGAEWSWASRVRSSIVMGTIGTICSCILHMLSPPSGNPLLISLSPSCAQRELLLALLRLVHWDQRLSFQICLSPNDIPIRISSQSSKRAAWKLTVTAWFWGGFQEALGVEADRGTLSGSSLAYLYSFHKYTITSLYILLWSMLWLSKTFLFSTTKSISIIIAANNAQMVPFWHCADWSAKDKLGN